MLTSLACSCMCTQAILTLLPKPVRLGETVGVCISTGPQPTLETMVSELSHAQAGLFSE